MHYIGVRDVKGKKMKKEAKYIKHLGFLLHIILDHPQDVNKSCGHWSAQIGAKNYVTECFVGGKEK